MPEDTRTCPICETAQAEDDSPYCTDCRLNAFGPRHEPSPAELATGCVRAYYIDGHEMGS
jgi:hypothetical protein